MARFPDHLAVYFGFKDPDPTAGSLETPVSARTSLKSPSFWLISVGVALALCAGYEGLAATLGDGDFDLGAVVPRAVALVLVVVVVRLFEAFSRWD